MPRRLGVMLACCWGAFVLIAAWMTLPIPSWVGQWFLFDHVPANRCTHALGLVNVAIVLLFLCRARSALPLPTFAVRLACFVGWGVLVYGALDTMDTALQDFYPTGVLVSAAVYAAVLIVCVTEHWIRTLACCVLLPLVAIEGQVNPLARDLHVIRHSDLFYFAQSRPEYRRDLWIIFSNWVEPAGFVTATGIRNLNSLKAIPYLDGLRLFDPDGQYEDIINQSGYLVAKPLPEGEPSTFSSPNPGILIWNVSPLDPRLKAMGVRYAIFNSPEPPDCAAQLKPLADGPVSNLWLYELP